MAAHKYPSREPERVRAYMRAWRKRNARRLARYRNRRLEERRIKQRLRWATDPQYRAEHKKKAREYYLKNKQKVYQKSKRWRERNRARDNARRMVAYYRDHERRKAKAREHARNRRKKTTIYQRAYRAARPIQTRTYTAQHHLRARKELRDGYLIQMLKRRYKILQPTAEQIERLRAAILAKRSQRLFRLIDAGSKL